MIPLTAAADNDAALSVLEGIKAGLENFDITKIFPNIPNMLNTIRILCRISVFVGPVLLLLLGLGYFFLAPKEANWYFGYHCYFGMGSVEAWQYTQHFAGVVFAGLGAVLLVAMIVVSMGFAAMEINALAWRCVFCLAAQAILAFLATLVINIRTMTLFDAKGRLKRS